MRSSCISPNYHARCHYSLSHKRLPLAFFDVRNAEVGSSSLLPSTTFLAVIPPGQCRLPLGRIVVCSLCFSRSHARAGARAFRSSSSS